ncbi:FecCD family ABC transporter permease [Mucilaginibacter polytrichastri]|uniref:Hemin transport system permease protein hmuU n=1 Tax=Mucilaginibacter polytrichastri TaxID=1302689 RepID=A0A1Q5ZXU2_9SPHI|nr:iron ABC transporter permease [Mucilaginibacter polytrichastri]OKS86580.1 Hemin transport system permease protein hmuU [Mucilaginibacter polytrichastri]SFS80400.1 iron complex transport system permease protein [Mucilaginibacter polytrichastri]
MVIKNHNYVLLGLSLLLIMVVVASICIGAVHIEVSQLWSMISYHIGLSHKPGFTSQQFAVMFNLRLPRVLSGVLIGAALAVSGSAIQGLFRNPLAEPGLIGISSGATLFAALTIVFGGKLLVMVGSNYGYYLLSAAAFAGAFITAWAVYKLAMHKGRTMITALLLTGIAINALAFSFTGLLTYISTDEQLRNLTFWSLGSLGGSSWISIASILPFISIPLAILPFMGKPLNALALGEIQAGHMGFSVNKIKRTVLILATMSVGASVAVAGIISFVGLVVPHIIRIGFGADNRLVIPGSAILGAAMLTLADLVSRTIVAPAELPIGIVTALAGSPVFIYMISIQIKKQQV